MKDSLLPNQRKHIMAAIQDHIRNNHNANIQSTKEHMKWCFNTDKNIWSHKKQINQIVEEYFKN